MLSWLWLNKSLLTFKDYLACIVLDYPEVHFFPLLFPTRMVHTVLWEPKLFRSNMKFLFPIPWACDVLCPKLFQQIWWMHENAWVCNLLKPCIRVVSCLLKRCILLKGKKSVYLMVQILLQCAIISSYRRQYGFIRGYFAFNLCFRMMKS